ncbi:MAG TPA: hypothetical protein VIV57_04350 [Anaeromyxobacter sp.]
MSAFAGNIGPRALAAAAALLLASGGCAVLRRHEAAPHAAPPGAERRAFAIPGHGALEIPVPKGWIAEASPEDPSRPSTIRLEPPGGGFVALLTPFWNTGEPEGAQARADAARLFAELARRNAMAGAQEQDIPLETLDGDGVHGFWFGATDRSLAGREPGPEEWRHVIQGAAAVGPLVVAFTLLDNEEGPQRETLLDLVRAARHVGPIPERGAGDEMEADPGARTLPLRVEISGKTWAVLVDLPGFRMFKPKRSDDGTGVLVLGQDPSSGMVASVILRPAGGAHDAAGCRDADLPKIRDSSELLDLRVAGPGASARATYAIAAPGSSKVRQEHGHAWLEREGICANVHVSKMAPAAEDAEVMDRILSSARFGEDL